MNGNETPAVPTRDYRPAKWTSNELALSRDAREVSAELSQPATGHPAFLIELTFLS
jgi:PhoPQ-activated pathogenicity-related protein